MNEVGEPVQVPTETVSVWPACEVPLRNGAFVTAGRVTVEPDADTATVGGEEAVAEPSGLCAVTATVRA